MAENSSSDISPLFVAGLWQELLDEKWYEGSPKDILSNCAFCRTYLRYPGGNCGLCPIEKYCNRKEGQIGGIYRRIIDLFHDRDIWHVNELPLDLLNELRAAIQAEIKLLRADAEK